MSDNVLTYLVGAEIRDAKPVLAGEVLSRPMLLKTDGAHLTYACDVKLSGYSLPVRNVPIANAAGDVVYADTGAAVTLSRTTTGSLEIIGYAKRKPGRRLRLAVNVETLAVGSPVNVGLSARPLTWGELGTIGGGWGAAPWGAVAIFRGDTLIEVR